MTGGWLPEPGSAAFKTMVGGFAKGGHYGDARKTGARFVSTKGKGPAPRVVDAAWLRSQKPDVLLAWPVESPFELGLPYPLTRPPYVRQNNYFEIQLHWSRHYIEEVPGTGAACSCGASLERPRRFGPRASPFTALDAKCRACGCALDRVRHMVTVSDERRRPVRVGPVRFAIAIACGKDLPEDGETPLKAKPELVAMCERRFACTFDEVGYVH